MSTVPGLHTCSASVRVFLSAPGAQETPARGTVGTYLAECACPCASLPYPTLPWMRSAPTFCAERSEDTGPPMASSYLILKPVWPQCPGTQVPAVWQVQASERFPHACARNSRLCQHFKLTHDFPPVVKRVSRVNELHLISANIGCFRVAPP